MIWPIPVELQVLLRYYLNSYIFNSLKLPFLQFRGEMCPDNVVGKIERFKELSGIVASRKYPVFYSIEDSQNKESVYVFLENGTLVGCKPTKYFLLLMML